MKYAIGIAVFFWLLCGLIGAWILDDLDSGHWKEIAYGAITLADALNEHPVTYPGPGTALLGRMPESQRSRSF